MTLQVLYLEPDPSQQFTLSIDGGDYDMRFDYNQSHDRWSLCIWKSGTPCPILAGRFIDTGQDILRGLGFETKIVLTDRYGVGVVSQNWFDRMTHEWGDGVPTTFMVIAAPADLELAAEIAC